MRRVLCLALLVAVCAGAQAATTRRHLTQAASPETCRSLFNAAGGVSGLTKFLPSCVPGDKYDADKCCIQAKSALGLAPQAGQCLCIAAVWNEVKTQAAGAGFGGTLSDFLTKCGVKVAGNGC